VVCDLLVEAWMEADAWLVGHYQVMPDHVHFFAAPHKLDIPLNRWMSYWKRLFTQKARRLSESAHQRISDKEMRDLTDSIRNPVNWKWQSLHWDTRLRRSESYTDKWNYVRENPAKEKLVVSPDDWPYQGTLNVLRW
jgi:REP element-mobilizing transposase RayT